MVISLNMRNYNSENRIYFVFILPALQRSPTQGDNTMSEEEAFLAEAQGDGGGGVEVPNQLDLSGGQKDALAKAPVYAASSPVSQSNRSSGLHATLLKKQQQQQQQQQQQKLQVRHTNAAKGKGLMLLVLETI